MPDVVSVDTKFLQNLWDDTEAARLSPLEQLRYRSNRARRRPSHHQLRRRQHQLEVRSAGSADRRADAGAGGERQRRRPAVDHGVRLRHALHGQARRADPPLSRRGARRRDGGVLSARARSARIASPRRSIRRCTPFCRSITSITCIPTGRSRSRPAPTAHRSWRSSTSSSGARSCGCPGSDRDSSWR